MSGVTTCFQGTTTDTKKNAGTMHLKWVYKDYFNVSEGEILQKSIHHPAH